MSASPVITFRQSGISGPWDASYEDLLRFAEANGVEISCGCQYGDCGTCLTDLISGQVEYLHEIGVVPDDGTCLPCSCRPCTDLTLDC